MHANTVQQTGDGKGVAVKEAQGAQGTETKRGDKLFCSANKGINSQEITPG